MRPGATSSGRARRFSMVGSWKPALRAGRAATRQDQPEDRRTPRPDRARGAASQPTGRTRRARRSGRDAVGTVVRSTPFADVRSAADRFDGRSRTLASRRVQCFAGDRPPGDRPRVGPGGGKAGGTSPRETHPAWSDPAANGIGGAGVSRRACSRTPHRNAGCRCGPRISASRCARPGEQSASRASGRRIGPRIAATGTPVSLRGAFFRPPVTRGRETARAARTNECEPPIDGTRWSSFPRGTGSFSLTIRVEKRGKTRLWGRGCPQGG